MKPHTNFLNLIIICLSIMYISGCQSGKQADQKSEVTVIAPIIAADTVAPDTAGKSVAAIAPVETVITHKPLTLLITNLVSADAPVIIGVYGKTNKFPDPKDQFKQYTFQGHSTELTAKITDLDFGAYALAIYQDVNSNGNIDKNLIGIPTEPYAFSNNYKPTVKAPCFANCKFDYDSTANLLTLNMIR